MTDAEFFSGLVKECAHAARIHRQRCDRDGLPFVFTSGRRTWAQQIELYGQGRERTPEGWKVVDRSKVVTDALPDEDPHVRGAAYDLCPIFQEKPAWSRTDLFAAIAERMPDGLSWSGTWQGHLHDFGHFELTNWREHPAPEPA